MAQSVPRQISDRMIASLLATRVAKKVTLRLVSIGAKQSFVLVV